MQTPPHSFNSLPPNGHRIREQIDTQSCVISDRVRLVLQGEGHAGTEGLRLRLKMHHLSIPVDFGKEEGESAHENPDNIFHFYAAGANLFLFLSKILEI